MNVYFLFGESWVDDKDNPINGQGRLCYVSRYDNLAAYGTVWLGGGCGFENSLLEGRGQSGVEGDALDISDLWAKIFNLTLNPLTTLLNFLEVMITWQ